MIRDFTYALRQLQRSPGFTVLAVAILALGIGANTALFSVVNGVLVRPLPFPEHERLVTLWERSPALGIEQQAVSPPTQEDWKSRSHSFEALAFWTGPSDFNLVTRDGTEKVRATYSSSALFNVLRVEPSLGRGFLEEEDREEGPQVAVISHQLWQRNYGGDGQVLGRTLTVDTYGRRAYTIVGVMPEGFAFPEDTELWLAAGWNGLPSDRRGGHWLNVLARLKPGVTLAGAGGEMNGIQAGIARDHPGERVGSEVSIVPLLRQTVGRNTRAALLILWGVVAAVLLIACANVANLMLARAVSRQKEIAVRLALGAGRGRLIRQLLTESVLLALLGGVLGILVGYAGMRAFVAASPANIPRLAEVSIDGAALGFTLVAALVTGLVFGLAPAWQCSRPDLNEALKEGGRAASGGTASGRMRQGLVVAEVALATVLLAGAGLMLQSLARLVSADRGVRAGQVVTAELDFSIAGFTTWVQPTTTRPQMRLKQLLDRLRELPGVRSAGAAYRFLRRDNRPPSQPFAIFGRPAVPDAERPVAEPNAISPGYLDALGIPLLRGRDLAETDQLESPGVALVNQAFVRRFFPDEDPLGKHLTMVGQPGALDARDAHGLAVWCEIVGVVGDVKSLSAQPESVPEIYRPYWQWPMQNPVVVVRGSHDPGTLIAAIRREVRSVIPNLPAPKIRRLTEQLGESVAQPRFQAGMLGLFAALASLLAACGIYGVLAYAVSQRRREMGIRLALGATRSQILALVVRQGLVMAGIGLAVGLAMACALTQFLRGLLYEVSPWDPSTFLSVGALLAVIALLASWLPAGRAAQTEPMAALRSE